MINCVIRARLAAFKLPEGIAVQRRHRAKNHRDRLVTPTRPAWVLLGDLFLFLCRETWHIPIADETSLPPMRSAGFQRIPTNHQGYFSPLFDLQEWLPGSWRKDGPIDLGGAAWWSFHYQPV